MITLFHHTFTPENKQLFRDLVDKVTVVRDKDQRPVEALQILFEYVDRRDIQIVGRLIEDETIILFGKKERKSDAVLLTAAEYAYLLVKMLFWKEKVFEIAVDMHIFPANINPVSAVGAKGLNQTLIVIEHHALLVEVADRKIPPLHLSAVRLHITQKYL